MPARFHDPVKRLNAEPALAGYHHLPSVRGDLLARLGRYREAACEFRSAASLTRNIPERTVLLRRAAECDARSLSSRPSRQREYAGTGGWPDGEQSGNRA
jgi:predicted RNA polymerase sigma factor